MENNKAMTTGFIFIIFLILTATIVGIVSLVQKDSYFFTSMHGVELEIYGGGIYRYHTVAQVYQVIPHDMVTLFFALPAFIISFLQMRKGSIIAKTVYTSVTLYLLFSYSIYTFFAIYNQLFIVYVSIMGITFYKFIYLLKITDYEVYKSKFRDNYKKTLNTYFLIFVPLLMAFVWLSGILPVTFGQAVSKTMLSEATTLVPHAIDLAFLLPFVFLAGLKLRKQQAIGYYMSLMIPIFLIFMMGSVLSKGLMLTITDTESALEMLIFIGLFFVLSIGIITLNLRAFSKAQ